MLNARQWFTRLALVVPLCAGLPLASAAQPNILVIFGDDVGVSNISAYNQGLMGYETPSIDRIAREGTSFTHAYGEQTCTAGRAAFKHAAQHVLYPRRSGPDWG
ncbi:sulfatase-like hydrolase/transferase [Pseudomonas sp. B21-040]|uniref:sulfatase-like hydrolase/transferase n=1 Tax=Pseudomonas sp. B21-040 TaxID=2895486 RepID=UPI00215ECA6B|nr:sulfatase-like hydrolase/transferase [Pseudomonas sp. B21-040]UVL43231.1 sulfatase-like hydrolase/transferase [Pseudomonas sp. B21-040]